MEYPGFIEAPTTVVLLEHCLALLATMECAAARDRACLFAVNLSYLPDERPAPTQRAGRECDRRLGPTITPQALSAFARHARRRIRTESGGYRRDHLRALARRVEVDAKEVRIMGSKGELLRALVAASSARTAGFGVPSLARHGRSSPLARRATKVTLYTRGFSRFVTST